MTTDVVEDHPSTVDQPTSGDASTSWIRTRVPVVLLSLTAAYAGHRAAGPITDPDTWWHLRLGREFREGWSLHDPGQLSPFATEPWVATQWTLEVLASFIDDWFGLAGVAALTGLATIGLCLLLWRRARECAAPLAAAVATVAGLVGVAPVIAPRPAIASLILLAVTLGAWRKTSTDLRPRWWLIPLTWVWAVTHGFWFIGVATGVAFVAGLAFGGSIDARRARKLLLVPLGSLVAAAATPAGPVLLTAPLQVNQIKDFITEWQPPDFRSPSQIVVAMLIALAMLTWSRHGKSAWVDLFIISMAAFLLLYAVRTGALSAVLLVPLTAGVLQSWVEGRATSQPLGTFSERNWIVVGMAAAVVVVIVSTLARAPIHDPYPRSIDRALDGLPIGSVVFNEYALGGWLSWQHPELVHVIDGMTEAYPPHYLAEYGRAFHLAPGWETFLKRVEATHALVPVNAGIAAELHAHLDWRVVARAGGLVLLARPSSTVGG